MNIFIRFWGFIRQEDRIDQIERNYSHQDDYIARLEQEHEAAIKMSEDEFEKKLVVLKDEIATALFMAELKPTWTSNIAEFVTCGFGKCDNNGFWDFTVPEEIVKQDKEMKKLLEIHNEN